MNRTIDTSRKRELFTRRQSTRRNWYLVGGLGMIVVVTVAFGLQRTRTPDPAGPWGDPVAAQRSYVGRFISMTAIEPTIDDDWVTLPLSVVADKNIVSFSVANSAGYMVPMMAYLSPSGRLFAGSSMCEPCRGRTFSLAGETLVCDTCRTTYTIEDHRFLSGSFACGQYPPVYMEPVVADGMIRIPRNHVLNWTIRA